MSSSLRTAAFALADWLMSSDPGQLPFRAVVFVLGLPALERANAKTAVVLHKRMRLVTKTISKSLQEKHRLDYDPLDVVEFNSFDELIGRRPPGRTVWKEVILITHAGGEAPGGFNQVIFFGQAGEDFLISSSTNQLLDAINLRINRVEQFRKSFDPASDLTLIGCGIGQNAPDVPIYVRELFATEGQVLHTKRNVHFFADGTPGTAEDPDRPGHLRPLVAKDWGLVHSKGDILNAVEPLEPADFDIHDP